MMFQLKIIADCPTCGIGQGRGALIFFADKERAYPDAFLCHRLGEELVIGFALFCQGKTYFIAVAEQEPFALGEDFFFQNGVAGQEGVKGRQRLCAVALSPFVPEAASFQNVFLAAGAILPGLGCLPDFFF